jgi:alkyl hydroperoxide reductase subunit F
VIGKDGGVFKATMEDGTVYRGRAVIFAAGKRHRELGVPGERELAGLGVAYCSICDAPFYAGQGVVVAGGGNSAATAMMDLLKVGAKVTAVNYAKGWQADPVILKAIKDNPALTMCDMHQVVSIEGRGKVTGVTVKDLRTGGVRVLQAGGVFVEIGLVANSAPVIGLAELNEAGELVVDAHCRTSVPGLFGAGDVTTVPYNQIVISAGEGAKAALAAYDWLIRQGDL